MSLNSSTQVFNFPQIQTINLDSTGTISATALTIGGVAIQTYIDTVAAGLKLYSSQGVIACAGNPNYPAATAGDAYVVSTNGRIGGVSGQIVTAGDVILCNTTTIAGDHATVGTKWDIIQGNLDMTNVAITGGSITGITDLAVADGGTGVSVSGVNKTFYVDGSRSDTYTADGSMSRPYKTIAACQDAINVITAGLVGSEANYETAKFAVKIAPGKYTDAITINTTGQAKYLKYEMEGVEISGAMTIKQEQLGLTDYYSKIDFVGGYGAFPEKGRCGRITGTITFLKTAYDSLAYDNFFGVEITGAILYGATPGTGYGTWVLGLENSSLSATSSITTNFAVGDHCVLLVTNGFNEVKCALTGEIDLYDCNNTTFYGALTITPTAECRLKNCHFTSTVSIIAAKNLYTDESSLKSIYDRTPTLTGMVVIPLSGRGKVQYNLTSSNILAMNATPITILPAVTGKTIVVDCISLKQVNTATQYANGGSVEFRYTDGSGAKVTADIAVGVMTSGAGTVYTINHAIVTSLTGVISSPIVITNADAPFITGTGEGVITIDYHLI
jgi:hypothetical protein